MTSVLDALSTPSFIEAVGLLVITAALTGFLVPFVKGRLDSRNLESQQLLQEALARKGKVVDAQAELLEVLADVLGGLRMLYTKIAFYAKDGRSAEYAAAFKDYEERSWNFLAGYRTQLSKAGRLTSRRIREALRTLYYDVLMPTDRRLYELVRPQDGMDLRATEHDSWSEFFDFLFTDFTDQIDDVLDQLTEEIRKAEAEK
jgi:hypothetical protein